MWVVAVMSVNAYPFVAFSDLTCHLEDTVISNFCFTVLPNSKETELGSSDQEASPSAGKNIGVVLVPCHTWKCLYSYSWWCGYSRGPWVLFVVIDEFSVRVAKVTLKIGFT